VGGSESSPVMHDTPRYRMVVLAMLVLVYTFNFIDRQIVGILAVPIKADLGLTDTQLGLMGGSRSRSSTLRSASRSRCSPTAATAPPS